MALAVYLDTNAIIRFIESHETEIVKLFDDSAEGLLDLYTSELTSAEALVVPFKIDSERLVQGYEDFLRSDEFLTVLPVDRDVLRMSAKLRAQFGGKAPDAIHVATASLQGCEVLISSDRRMRIPPGLKRVAIEDIEEWGKSR